MPIASIFSSFSGIWFTFPRVVSPVGRGIILNRNKYVARLGNWLRGGCLHLKDCAISVRGLSNVC
jgi:hypothetical protein